jgi:hypothetical protein
VLVLRLHGFTLLWCWQIKHDDMCEAVQRFGEQLAAAGTYLQDAWAVQAAQLQTLVSRGECCADGSSMAIGACWLRHCMRSDWAAFCICDHTNACCCALQVEECREAAGSLQAQLQQGVFVDAYAAAPDAIAELQNLLDNISELQVPCRFANGAKQAVASSEPAGSVAVVSCCYVPHHLHSGAILFNIVQELAQQYQAYQAANGLPVEQFDTLAAAQEEAAWRLEVWSVYQAVAEQMSAITTSPILSNVDNKVGTSQQRGHVHYLHDPWRQCR